LPQVVTDLLCTHFHRVLLMLDGDDAGRHGSTAIRQTLAGRVPVSVISLDDRRQPDQLASEEIQRILAPYDVARSHT
jgi:hypothetical protein